MKAYKLIRVLKDGNCYPLFIGKTTQYEFGKWLNAKCIPTKGFAVRKGFHCCFKPYAPHLKTKLATGERRVWIECEVDDYTTYDRPESQGGTWILAQKMKIIRKVPEKEIESILKE